MNNNVNKENETNKNEIRRGVILENVTPELVESALKDYSENAKYNVDYFSVYCSQLRDYDFMDKVEEYGAHYFLFLQYLKMEMLDFAKFYILEKNIKRLIKQYCCNFSASENEIKNIYDDLIKSKYISVISVSDFECPLIVEPIVFYNYRLTNEQRLKNRERQAKTREKKKFELEELQEKVANFESKNIEPAPTAPAEISQDNFNDFTVVNAEAENDNIFDEIEKESLLQKEEVKKISADDIPLVDNMFDNWDEGGF